MQTNPIEVWKGGEKSLPLYQVKQLSNRQYERVFSKR